MLYIGMCLSQWEAISDLYSLCCLYIQVFLSSTYLFNLFYYSFTYSALCLYPFIFLWLLIPTVNKIFHLNTNKAICMTANQYQKSRDGYCVVCNIAMVLM